MDDLEADLKAVKEEETASLETENKSSSENAPDAKVEEKLVNGESAKDIKTEKIDAKPEGEIDPPAESGTGRLS
jgi:hypothetical protein